MDRDLEDADASLENDNGKKFIRVMASPWRHHILLRHFDHIQKQNKKYSVNDDLDMDIAVEEEEMLIVIQAGMDLCHIMSDSHD